MANAHNAALLSQRHGNSSGQRDSPLHTLMVKGFIVWWRILLYMFADWLCFKTQIAGTCLEGTAVDAQKATKACHNHEAAHAATGYNLQLEILPCILRASPMVTHHEEDQEFVPTMPFPGKPNMIGQVDDHYLY